MAELKTKATKKSAVAFIQGVTPLAKREDALKLLEIFKTATGLEPVMWGTAIVGFGMYHYESERSAQKGDWPLVAFSPRKQNLSLYLLYGDRKRYADLLQKLGKHKLGVGCLYVNKLADIDLKVLAQLVKKCYADNKKALVK